MERGLSALSLPVGFEPSSPVGPHHAFVPDGSDTGLLSREVIRVDVLNPLAVRASLIAHQRAA